MCVCVRECSFMFIYSYKTLYLLTWVHKIFAYMIILKQKKYNCKKKNACNLTMFDKLVIRLLVFVC